MFLGLNYKHRDAVVVDVVYDAVVGCDVTRIGHIATSDKRFGVADLCGDAA